MHQLGTYLNKIDTRQGRKRLTNYVTMVIFLILLNEIKNFIRGNNNLKIKRLKENRKL